MVANMKKSNNDEYYVEMGNFCNLIKLINAITYAFNNVLVS